ncbi:MAG: sulfatase-like hydrolase/transferase [Gammaproteobacteria bacterium]|nr:sulfatase-like hydrolase/transferase [Gammaproteobacteria bacterium]MDH5302738.1 sulfatase-like hydrolase/transferase [Gammaproteobacteria bacterium]MDH5321330.1 sulfatase-like hydrolase/transferase [Gammaproteobacteria bacterium]
MSKKNGISRRDLIINASAGLAVASLVGTDLLGAGGTSVAQQRTPVRRAANAGHNILFVFTDQQRHFDRWPRRLDLPGHERLARNGTYFGQHHIGATMCTSSRSIMMTGLQTAVNGMYENLDVPWVRDLSPEIPTIGHMLRQAGYYTAYKGKWHLTRAFDQQFPPERLFTREMEAYGFADYVSPGDVVGHTLGGYSFDHIIAGSAISWLRRVGRPLSDEAKPWALTVGLVNPHDIMYFNTDAPGQKVQDNGQLLSHAAPAPRNESYAAEWDMPIPASLTQAFDEPGRPAAHREFGKAWDYVLGHIPPEEERWRRFNNFYINSIRSVDAQLTAILSELDALGMSDNTIVVYTADHGEAGGAHGLRGKGPFAYRETFHVPMYVVHPDVRGGQHCGALTAHIDIAPSLLALAGADQTRSSEIAGRELPGKDFSALLNEPRSANVNAIREAALFTYSGIASNDGDLMPFIANVKAAGKDPKTEMAATGFRPNLKKRGTVRSVFDGRYTFSRYFSPTEHHKPASLDELYRYNDLELYDRLNDPDEMTNLAADRATNGDLVLAMSNKLESIIATEIGVDDGSELPDVEGVDWALPQARFD